MELHIQLNIENSKIGKGTFQYVKKEQKYTGLMPDLGSYQLQVDNINRKVLYVYYKNMIPNGLAEGYEIWEKIK